MWSTGFLAVVSRVVSLVIFKFRLKSHGDRIARRWMEKQSIQRNVHILTKLAKCKWMQTDFNTYGNAFWNIYNRNSMASSQSKVHDTLINHRQVKQKWIRRVNALGAILTLAMNYFTHFNLTWRIFLYFFIYIIYLCCSFSSFLFSTEEQCLPSHLLLLLLISNKFFIKNDLHWNILQLNALELNINTSNIQMLTRKTYRKWVRCEPMMGGVGGNWANYKS